MHQCPKQLHNRTVWYPVLSEISITHIVFQAFNDLNAIVAQIELFQVDKVLQPLNFSNPITLKTTKQKTNKQKPLTLLSATVLIYPHSALVVASTNGELMKVYLNA